MALYNFELAFDWNSKATGTYTPPGTLEPMDECPLLIGLANVGVKNSYSGFKSVLDSVCFDGVNLTSGAGDDMSKHSIIGGSITFQNEGLGTPFNIDVLTISTLGASGNKWSTGLFEPLYPKGDYPSWSAVPLIQFARQGTFIFKVRLIVAGTDGNDKTVKKAFFHDPEMIVQGPAGG